MPGVKNVVLLLVVLFVTSVKAQLSKENKNTNSKVTDIWVVFKTHFDLGYTDLPENVFKRYREEMMDNALKVIENEKTVKKTKPLSGKFHPQKMLMKR